MLPNAGLFSFVTALYDSAMYWCDSLRSLVNTANLLLFDASFSLHDPRFNSLPKQDDGTGFWFKSWVGF